MYQDLKSQLAELLTRPRPLKPQTERQIAQYLQENGGDAAGYLTKAANILEEHELEILFAPQFTPTLDEQAAVSDVLSSWRPTPADLERLIADLCAAKGEAVFQLSDNTEVRIPLHEVMISRFVRLMRLDQAPEFELAAKLQDALPTELCTVALALMRQRGFTPQRNAWLAAFLCHLARQPLSRSVVISAAEFISAQTAFDTPSLLSAAEELVRATKGSADYAAAGRIYWSPDVAQHHQYRGEGQVDKARVKQKYEELAALETIAAALFSFGAVRP